MTRRALTSVAAGGSTALLLGAFGFQAFGYAPCEICLWQRWPHGAAIVIGLLVLWRPHPAFILFGALAALTTASIGGYHTGVEQGWWAGPSSCTGDGAGLTGLTGSNLLSVDAAAPIVMCDDISWSLLGLSMAAWNALISLSLACVWLFALKR